MCRMYTLLRFLGDEYSSREGFLRLSLRIIRAAANAMMLGDEQLLYSLIRRICASLVPG